MDLSKYKHIYLIGIGGISISAIAKLFLHHKVKVSGFDLVESDITTELESMGADIIIHDKTSLPDDVDLVIYSEAVKEDDVIRTQAKEKNIKQLNGSQFWGKFAKDKKVIAVSGTNGKSTTTAILGFIMEQAGLDPTVVVGTRVLQWNSNIRIGNTDWLVIEADEYAAKMLEYKPFIAVITNIAADHLDYYKDINDIISHFQKWVDSVPGEGAIIINRDDKNLNKISIKHNNLIKFGIGGSTGVRSAGVIVTSGTNTWLGNIGFNIVSDKEDWGYVEYHLPGEHNMANAITAAIAADLADIKKDKIIKLLGKFKGTWRRFELVGEYNKALIVSDYAHHPDGIKATLKAARQWYPFNRIIVLFEPHQHNRTKNLFDDFVESFNEADEVIVSEIYDVAGRTTKSDQKASSKDLVNAIKKSSPSKLVEYTPDLASAESMLKEKIKPEDVAIIMGAGNVDQVARNIATIDTKSELY
jgi:UDP-N-acetylmuramate--alanine ligase